MTRICATVLRLSIVGLTAAALGACFPLMFDRDGNWRGQQPVGPAFGNDLQPEAGVGSIHESSTGQSNSDETEATGTDEDSSGGAGPVQ